MIRNRREFLKDYFPSPPENEGLSKRTFLKVAAFAGLGISPFLNTCRFINNGDTNQGAVKKPDNPAEKGSIPKADRPPIDLAAPAKIETATFALG
jgi:hypothetical protein